MNPFETIGALIMALALGVFGGYGLREYVEGIEAERNEARRVIDEQRRRLR